MDAGPFLLFVATKPAPFAKTASILSAPRVTRRCFAFGPLSPFLAWGCRTAHCQKLALLLGNQMIPLCWSARPIRRNPLVAQFSLQLGCQALAFSFGVPDLLRACRRVVEAMVEAGWKRTDVDALPPLVVLPLLEVLHVCKEFPPAGMVASCLATSKQSP